MTSITEGLARYAFQCSFDDLPQEVVIQAKRCFTDTIGVMLAAAESPTVKILTALIQDLGGNQQASVVKGGGKTTVLNASLINGAMAHVLDFDDLHSGAITHTSAVLIPAVLSGGEWKERDGKEVICSFVAGFEVMTRISMAAGMGQHQLELGWHPTSTVGRFGAAVCFGKMLHASASQLAASMGIAATQSSGLIRVFGTMTKHLNAGKASHDGVFSALLAHRGFSAPADILEGEDGFCRVLSGKFDPKPITENLGQRFEIMNNSFKPYPSCRQTHPVVDACSEIYKKYSFRPADIKEVICEVNPVAPQTAGIEDPHDANEAKFSLYYCAARALMGDVSMSSFRIQEIEDEEVRKLMKCIKIKTNPSFNIANACVEVKTASGQKAISKVNASKGSPENRMTDSELESKFLNLALPVIKDNRKTEDILHILNELEKEKNLSNLMRLLS
ncbi:MAG: MmgE/PrpD family protein [Pseudomonadota bacterium]